MMDEITTAEVVGRAHGEAVAAKGGDYTYMDLPLEEHVEFADAHFAGDARIRYDECYLDAVLG